MSGLHPKAAARGAVAGASSSAVVTDPNENDVVSEILHVGTIARRLPLLQPMVASSRKYQMASSPHLFTHFSKSNCLRRQLLGKQELCSVGMSV